MINIYSDTPEMKNGGRMLMEWNVVGWATQIASGHDKACSIYTYQTENQSVSITI